MRNWFSSPSSLAGCSTLLPHIIEYSRLTSNPSHPIPSVCHWIRDRSTRIDPTSNTHYSQYLKIFNTALYTFMHKLKPPFTSPPTHLPPYHPTNPLHRPPVSPQSLNALSTSLLLRTIPIDTYTFTRRKEREREREIAKQHQSSLCSQLRSCAHVCL